MATYDKCDESVEKIVSTVMKRHHQPLADAKVTVQCLFARSATGSPAVSANGYPAIASIKIVSLKDRVAGMADALMLIDEDEWRQMTDAQKVGLIDHELTHLEVVVHKKGKKEGTVKKDDAGRPKLKIRKHDWQLGGFYEVVERNQMNAPETAGVIQVNEKFKQGVLAFG